MLDWINNTFIWFRTEKKGTFLFLNPKNYKQLKVFLDFLTLLSYSSVYFVQRSCSQGKKELFDLYFSLILW